jgi:integrase
MLEYAHRTWLLRHWDLSDEQVVDRENASSRVPFFAVEHGTVNPQGRKSRFLNQVASACRPNCRANTPGRSLSVAPFSRHTLRKRFRTACKVLGAARLETLTIHHGRHTFISHALASGRTLAEVRDVAGHANVIITSGYLHVAVDDWPGRKNLFRLS